MDGGIIKRVLGPTRNHTVGDINRAMKKGRGLYAPAARLLHTWPLSRSDQPERGGRYRYLIWRRFCVANSVVDPVPYSEYVSGSTKLLDTDPTRIRIHNTGCKCAALFVDR